MGFISLGFAAGMVKAQWKPLDSGEEVIHGVDLLLAVGRLCVLSASEIHSFGLARSQLREDTTSPNFKNKIKIKKPDATRGSRYSCSWTVVTSIPGGDTMVLSLQLSSTCRTCGNTLKSIDLHVLAGEKTSFPH